MRIIYRDLRKSIQSFFFRKMTEMLVFIRRLQKITALPIPVNTTIVKYIVIDIVPAQVLVALFSPMMHPSSTSCQIWIRAHVEIHLFFASHKDVMNDNIIIIDVEAVGVQDKIADIGIQQIPIEMNGSFFLELFKAILDFFTGYYLNKLFVCDRLCYRISYAKTVSSPKASASADMQQISHMLNSP